MSRLCLNIEPSDDTTAMSETVSDIDKRVARLFDCVNAGALDFAWRNRNGVESWRLSSLKKVAVTFNPIKKQL